VQPITGQFVFSSILGFSQVTFVTRSKFSFDFHFNLHYTMVVPSSLTCWGDTYGAVVHTHYDVALGKSRTWWMPQ
jgi:hypothetical protein